MANNEPLFGHGKICYIEIPSDNIERSATFYQHVFDWKIDRRDDGSVTFDDSLGYVSGMWTLNKKPSTGEGIMISIMVTDAAKTLDDIIAHGGKIVQPVDATSSEIMALFSDPTGNVWCIYQHGD